MSLSVALVDHARRLLLGSGLSVEDAAQVAAGQSVGRSVVASALRDGWTAAERTGGGGRSR